MDASVIDYLARWGHFLAGITWIGLLYYFNFVQTEYFKEADPSARTDAFTKLVPRALWWFRWAATVTVLTGLILGYLSGYIHDAMSFGAMNDFAVPKNITKGIGMWLGIVM